MSIHLAVNIYNHSHTHTHTHTPSHTHTHTHTHNGIIMNKFNIELWALPDYIFFVGIVYLTQKKISKFIEWLGSFSSKKAVPSKYLKNKNKKAR